ncbi:hypothetical protein CEXT_516131 [Caerostris extrusa]|uniref:Maturase K n=1 Tax=Caerostris extrusa TaxID=172846 RepID=A0AAV4T4D9_CAEEX|nr:hypothetical protein CEXT_516131 [Caerostris extrusa]
MCSFGSREFLLLIIFPFPPKRDIKVMWREKGLYKVFPLLSKTIEKWLEFFEIDQDRNRCHASSLIRWPLQSFVHPLISPPTPEVVVRLSLAWSVSRRFDSV